MDYIVILERTALHPLTIRFMLRADVPVARQVYYADAEKASLYPNATPEELVALRAGQVIETSDTVNVQGLTVAQIKAELIGAQAAFQAKVSADGEYNPWKYYGTRWDKSAWTTAGVN